MANEVSDITVSANALYVNTWTEFKKYLNGTIASLQFHYADHDGKFWRIVTQEWGGNSYWIDLTQDGGADDLDFQNNFQVLSEREPVAVSMEGLGVAGTPSGGVMSIQGVAGGTPMPISGSITATNDSVGVNGAAVPGSSTQIGATDGTNLRNVRAYDVDDGAGSEYALGVVLRRSESGGSVEIGDSANPIRVDPTGTTAQPVTDNGGSLTVDGSVSVSNFPAVQSVDDNGGSLTVDDGGSSLTVDGTVAATQSGSWTVTADAGTGFAPVVTDGSAAGTTGYHVLGTDGTNAQILSTNASGHVNIADGGNSITVDGSVSVSGTADVNVASVGGNAVAVNAGNANSGTQRVVIATDQSVLPVSDNGGSLTVDGSVSVSNFPAVQSVDDNGGSLTVDDGGSSLTVDGTVTANAGTGFAPVVTDGSAAGTTGYHVLGTDGTNAQIISTDSSGRLNVVEAGFATFAVSSVDAVSANNKSMLSILNADASLVVKIREIYVTNVRTDNIAGITGIFEFRRATGHSAGTSLTPQSHDSADSLDSDITVRTGATIAGEASAFLYRKQYATDEWKHDNNSHIVHAVESYFPVYKAEAPMKPIVLRQNEALTVKFATDSGTGIFDIVVVFTQE